MTLIVQAMAMVIVVAQAMARNNGEDDLCRREREKAQKMMISVSDGEKAN